MEMHMQDLVARNLITRETAIEKTGNANLFRELDADQPKAVRAVK